MIGEGRIVTIHILHGRALQHISGGVCEHWALDQTVKFVGEIFPVEYTGREPTP